MPFVFLDWYAEPGEDLVIILLVVLPIGPPPFFVVQLDGLPPFFLAYLITLVIVFLVPLPVLLL